MQRASCKLFVCVCTFRRQADLAKLLKSLHDVRRSDEFVVELIVIDNDLEPSAKEVFDAETQGLDWTCRYVHEVEPGIPSARNRAIAEAGTEGYLVFVDDDETVDADWLIELWKISKKTNATFVQGPVRMLVDDEQDDWWLATRFFLQNSFDDGAERKESWTNNVLFDLAFVAEHDCKFDERLRFDGGSDTLFFQDIVRKGGTGAFAANAWVSEVQPRNRLTWKWAMNRQYRYGSTRAMTVMLRRSRWEAIMYCVVRGGGMAVVGLGLLATAFLRGKRGVADGMALLSRSAGILAGMFGKRMLEYAR